ncbi:MAG: hypothetical protein ACP5Q1_10125 [Anaerolineae bacterium]
MDFATSQGSNLGYNTTFHDKRAIYGHGGLFPRHFMESINVLSQFPDPDSIALLRSWGVRYVLLYPADYGEEWERVYPKLMMSPDLHYVTEIQEEPMSSGDRLLHQIPEYRWWFTVGKVYVYEIMN